MGRRFNLNRRYVKSPWNFPLVHDGCIVCGSPFHSPPAPWEEGGGYISPSGWIGPAGDWISTFNMEAKELEEMEFPAHSYVPMTFVRAILDKPGHALFVSGITQLEFNLSRTDEEPIPYDPLKARVGAPARLGNKYFAEYFAANLFGLDHYRDKGRRIGYRMHMPCWVLLCRLVGKQLIEEYLDCFVATVRSFWRSNISKWDLSSVEDYDDNCYGIMPWSERPWIWPKYAYGDDPAHPEHWLQVNIRENPGSISDIHQLIRNASLVPGQPEAIYDNYPVHKIPLEIAVMIVDLIRKQPGSKVDWQILCLGLEELLFDHH